LSRIAPITAKLFFDTDACTDAVYLYGDDIMIDSYLIQPELRGALPPRTILSTRRAATVLALMFALAIGVFAGGSNVHAQETRPQGATTTVNINTANAQTLAAALNGVGESRAGEIVRHRETYGPFASADELMEVKGIGKSTLDMNRKLITLE
jgi:competence protein ComEA